MLNDNEYTIQFPTIFEYSNSHTNAKQQNECGQYFSKYKIFINNGDTFNGKYIIEYFQKTPNIDTNYTNNDISNLDTTELYKIINEMHDYSTLIENINIISSISLLTKKKYNMFLDKPSNIKKIQYLSNHYNKCLTFFKPHLTPFKQPNIKEDTITNKNNFHFKIITSLFNEQLKVTHTYLKKCTIIKNNNMPTKLMQCSTTIFDITSGSEREIQQARVAFNYIYNELIKYSDEEIIRIKEKGIIRKFILISTVMTWMKDISNYSINSSEDEEIRVDITQENILERLPTTKYQIIFEFEKLILKSNFSKIKNIFKTYIISTGIIYGHEENALRYIFYNAWNNPKEMYTLILNRTVPVFHIDELAKLIFIILKYNNNIKDNYILAVEQESYGFNNILKSVCDELCSSRLISKEDYFIKNLYKFDSYTWDLICANLIIDPMLDIVIPDYKILRKPIISNMNKLTREYIKGTNLKAIKLIIYGHSTHVTSNIAERLSQYFQVELINIPNLIKKHLISLINIRNELMLKMHNLHEQRTKIIHLLSKLADHSKNKSLDSDDGFIKEGYYLDEIINDEMVIMDDKNYTYEMYDKLNLSDNDIFLEPSETSLNIISVKDGNYNIQNNVYNQYIKNKKDNELLDIDKEIDILKKKLDNLNDRYKKYKNYNQPLDIDNHLLLLIKESLTSFSCHNQGYIFDIFPLSVQQIEYIFNNEIVYPNIIVLLNNKNPSKFCEYEKITCSTINRDKRYKYLDHNSLYPNNSKYQKLDTYENDIDYNNTKSQTNVIIDVHDPFKHITETTFVNNNYKYEITLDNIIVDYFANKGINTLRFTVPLELDEETSSYNIQYEIITDAIITQIGNSHIMIINEIYLNDAQIIKRNRTLQSIINKINMNEKLKKTLNKLNTMKQQWNKEIFKTIEFKKKQDYNKSVKIHNFLNTSILPKLLKEISPNDFKKSLVPQFPEKTLNKTILCSTQIMGK